MTMLPEQELGFLEFSQVILFITSGVLVCLQSFIINCHYFPDAPDITQACKQNSAPLTSMANTCYEAAGKQWPNFIDVNFYKRSDGGGALEVIEAANGHLVCGCGNTAYCQTNMTFGACDLLEPCATPVPSAYQSGFAYSSRSVRVCWLLEIALGTVFRTLLTFVLLVLQITPVFLPF